MTHQNRLKSQNLWTIVLAAGEGSRLLPLTRALHGRDLPKQYASIHGKRSLLQATLSRTVMWSEPSRTVVVVAEEYESMAREQLREFDRVQIVTQPKNCGTGPGVLLPLSHVLAQDPTALVAVVPSDHYVRERRPLVESVRRADAVARSDGPIVLIGAVPEAPETQYGWIVAESDRVERFIEKPPPASARELFHLGALWNTFMMVGPAMRFRELGRRRVPALSSLFDVYQRAIGKRWEHEIRSQLYAKIEPADFCRDFLEAADSLRIVRLQSCGWSDWGTPERVLASLEGTPDHERLSERLRITACEDNAA